MEYRFVVWPAIFLGIMIISFTITIFNFDSKSQVFGKTLDISAGVGSGDVTNNSAILWSKTNESANMNIDLSSTSSFINFTHALIPVTNSTDYSGHYKAENLRPNTEYYYKIWFSGTLDSVDSSDSIIGKFKTAPVSNEKRNISFAVGGDLGGQEYCIKVDIGYPIFRIIKELTPDFFIANGDMIYADSTCPAKGPVEAKGWKNIPGLFLSILDPSVDWTNEREVYSIYSEHWKYNKKELHYQNLYRNTPIYAQADDHEVLDDYSGNSSIFTTSTENRTGFKNLVKAGMESFFNYSPITIDSDDPTRIFRNFNWGANLELFLLDAHQYKSPGYLVDDSENKKTLLGQRQMEWLKNGLENSDSVWKVVSMNVPISVPHCLKEKYNGCNNWATDNSTNKTFTRERTEFMRFLDDRNIKNVVFVVTDAHYAANILIDQDFDGDGDNLKVYEFISGPLNAGTFGPDPLDPTVNASYIYKETGFFNFGYYEIKEMSDLKPHFLSHIINSDGLVRKSSIVDLSPA